MKGLTHRNTRQCPRLNSTFSQRNDGFSVRKEAPVGSSEWGRRWGGGSFGGMWRDHGMQPPPSLASIPGAGHHVLPQLWWELFNKLIRSMFSVKIPKFRNFWQFYYNLLQLSRAAYLGLYINHAKNLNIKSLNHVLKDADPSFHIFIAFINWLVHGTGFIW